MWTYHAVDVNLAFIILLPQKFCRMQTLIAMPSQGCSAAVALAAATQRGWRARWGKGFMTGVHGLQGAQAECQLATSAPAVWASTPFQQAASPPSLLGAPPASLQESAVQLPPPPPLRILIAEDNLVRSPSHFCSIKTVARSHKCKLPCRQCASSLHRLFEPVTKPPGEYELFFASIGSLHRSVDQPKYPANIMCSEAEVCQSGTVS